jgi:hypothetical protein
LELFKKVMVGSGVNSGVGVGKATNQLPEQSMLLLAEGHVMDYFDVKHCRSSATPGSAASQRHAKLRASSVLFKA